MKFPSNLQRREQEAEILRLRNETELNVYEIAEQMGISHSTVARRLRDVVARNVPEQVDIYREAQNAELDELNEILWPQAREGNLQAVDRLLKAMQRRAALNGTDLTPTINVNQHVTVTTQQDIELQALLAEAEVRNRVIEGELADLQP